MKQDPFIQVFAWLMLTICGLGIATGSLTTVLLFWVAGDTPLTVTGQHTGATLVLFRHLDLFVLLFLAYSLAGLVASVGLLRGDRPWARMLWIFLLGVGIGWALLVMGLEIFYPDPPEPASAPGSLFPSVSTLALFAIVPFGLGTIAVSAWLIHRLRKGLCTPRSPDIRQATQGPA